MSTSAEGPETTALQVMSPNAAAGHEGTSQPAEVNRGSNGSLPNGVASREFLLSTSDSRPGAGDVIPSTVDEFLVGREAGMGHEAQELTEVNSVAVAQGSLPGQSTSGGQASVAATMALQDGSVHAVRANMEVQQGSSSLTVVRWISRLNDFLANQGQSVLGLGADDEVFSESSVAVQAEVQRQMEATMRTQSRQMEEMREEIQYLRAESGAG
eukprot:s3773_g4.t1